MHYATLDAGSHLAAIQLERCVIQSQALHSHQYFMSFCTGLANQFARNAHRQLPSCPLEFQVDQFRDYRAKQEGKQTALPCCSHLNYSTFMLLAPAGLVSNLPCKYSVPDLYRLRTYITRRSTRQPPVTATQSGGGRRGRLGTRLTTIPRRVDYYFAGSWTRQLLWTAIAFATGFYAANTVSLSFGALSINDVVAAAVTVLFVEICSYLYYTASKRTLRLVFLNAFKWGVCAALIIDAFKLGG